MSNALVFYPYLSLPLDLDNGRKALQELLHLARTREEDLYRVLTMYSELGM